MTYKKAVWKRNTELVLMIPLILLGKLAGWLFPLKTKHTHFLFFSSADIGGAIRVNAEITECIKAHHPLIIFSKKPNNNEFRHLFDIEGVQVLDLHRYIDNKWYHFINIFYRGMIASWINKADKPVVFGGECIYFYKIIPHIRNRAKRVELCHLNTWLNFSQAFVKYIDARVFSTQKIKRDVEQQYRDNKVPANYRERLHFIDNTIAIPALTETNNDALQVVYIGRGAPQKRVHLIAAIARQLHETNRGVHFSFVGDVESIVPAASYPYCTFYGNIKDELKLQSICAQSDILILTSAYEGLPLVVMQMMALGKVVLSTAVDSIPDYITHKENGLLIVDGSEEQIIKQAIELLEDLTGNPSLRKSIGNKAREYAIKHFGHDQFCGFYGEMLRNEK